MPKQLFQRQAPVPRNSKMKVGGPPQQQDWGRKKGKVKKPVTQAAKPAEPSEG